MMQVYVLYRVRYSRSHEFTARNKIKQSVSQLVTFISDNKVRSSIQWFKKLRKGDKWRNKFLCKKLLHYLQYKTENLFLKITL